MLYLEKRDDVAVVRIDLPDAAVNTLSPAVLAAFDDVLDEIEADAGIRGVVFISGKPDSFIVGADLKVLQTLESRAAVEAMSREGHRLIHRMRDLGRPVVAAIHGPALGGGLEVALACTYRMATDDPRTRLGLPEVRLGLLPGGGGTQLLPALVGVQQALGMMLTGKNVYPRSARRMGLVDALIHRHGLQDAAVEAARRLADGTLAPGGDRRALPERLLESNALTRRVVYAQARKRVHRETLGNYPAPPRIIDCVEVGREEGLEAGLQEEAYAFSELAFTPVSRQLVFLFFAQREAQKNPWRDAARPVRKVGIVGAGLMGAGIAQVSAEEGMDVLLKDIDLQHAAAGKARVWRETDRKVRKRILTPFERDALVERITPVADYAPFSDAGLVVEAAPEDLALKKAVLADAEAEMKGEAIYASNTSSIPIHLLAEASSRPEQVIGMHYFSPVPQMPLLEIIRTDRTPDWVLGTAVQVGLDQGKTVIVVGDGPGFYTTRILGAYQNEALQLLSEGADIADVDRAMKAFGFPMGPYTLFDLVGVDVAAKITDAMGDFLAQRGVDAHDGAARMSAAGLKGQKTMKGFYTYTEGKRGKPEREAVNEAAYAFFGGSERRPLDVAHIHDRLALMMVNEATYCLQEGILGSPRDGDVGAVFGLGFPPFRGGPFRFLDAETTPAVAARLERLAREHGPRYKPSPLLSDYALTGRRFYDA